jgi:hypothetical protein
MNHRLPTPLIPRVAESNAVAEGRVVEPLIPLNGHLTDVRHHRRPAEGRRRQPQKRQEQSKQGRRAVRFGFRRFHQRILFVLG